MGDFNGKVLTNVDFKNLTEQLGFRGRQEHYDAYVEDVIIRPSEDGTEVVEFREGPTKIRNGGLTIRRRKTPQAMFSTDGGKKRSSEAIPALVVRATRRNEEHRATLSKHHKST